MSELGSGGGQALKVSVVARAGGARAMATPALFI